MGGSLVLIFLFACATENNQDVIDIPDFEQDLRAAIDKDIEATGAPTLPWRSSKTTL